MVIIDVILQNFTVEMKAKLKNFNYYTRPIRGISFSVREVVPFFGYSLRSYNDGYVL